MDSSNHKIMSKRKLNLKHFFIIIILLIVAAIIYSVFTSNLQTHDETKEIIDTKLLSWNNSNERIYGDTYSFLIPEGWRIATKKEMQNKINQLKNEYDYVLPEFDFSLVLENATNLFEQNIIVRTNNDGKILESKLNEFFPFETIKLNEIKEMLNETYDGLLVADEIKKQFFDKEKKIIYFVIQMSPESITHITQIQAWLLTETGYIQIIGSFPHQDFEKRLKSISSVIDSFILDNKYK